MAKIAINKTLKTDDIIRTFVLQYGEHKDESDNGLMESDNGLMESDNGLMESDNALMESDNGLMELDKRSIISNAK